MIQISIAGAVAALLVVGAAIFLGGNHAYRWNQACAAQGGVKMEDASGTRICIKGPVELINIAARPW